MDLDLIVFSDCFTLELYKSFHHIQPNILLVLKIHPECVTIQENREKKMLQLVDDLFL